MILYDIIFILFSVFYIPFSICKKGFRSFNLKARLGFMPLDLKNKLGGKKNIWIHAVSVGEAMVIKQLLQFLKKDFPDYHVVISTVTKTGNDVAKNIAGGNASVIYSPLDISFVVRKFVNAINPKVFIIVETEIWPNLIKIVNTRKVPIILINGRISPRSFKRYGTVKLFLKPILKRISLFCMQNQNYASRIISLGADSKKVEVTGNMKLDSIPQDLKPRTENRELLGLSEKDILLLAGSTHKGEESDLLDVYKDLNKDFRSLKLLIAPRHIERISQIESLIKNKGFIPVRVSNINTHDLRLATCDHIFLLDTIGQLKDFYSIADIVFVGGSLIQHGGQNPIEPAYFSRPIIFGPFMFNFEDIAQALLKQGAALEVKNKSELGSAIKLLMKDPKKCYTMGFFARKTIDEVKGASEKNSRLIRKILQEK